MAKLNQYLSLIKFSHTIFAMPFAIIGFFLGMQSGQFKQKITELHVGVDAAARDIIYLQQAGLKLALIVLCMVFARSAAMAFNRWLDAGFDAKNPRTAIREIPAGIIGANSALRFVLVNCILFIACTFFINGACLYLSPIALFVVLGYSYTKRFTPLCHIVLGIGLALAPIGAYIAVTGQFALLPILFSFAVLFWVSGFDIIYALQDEEFDRNNSLRSIPAWLGKAKALRLSRILHFFAALIIFTAGFYGHFGAWFWAAAAVFAGLLIYQQRIVSPTDLSKVNLAFFTTNGIAAVVFATLVVIDIVT